VAGRRLRNFLSRGLNTVYAHGHAKFAHVEDRDLPNRKGAWYDHVHRADGQ